MPRGERQKQKLLRLVQIMLQQSDENHPLSAATLIEKLKEYGISAERKSIYDDMNTLIECGWDIENRRGPGGGYFLTSRRFEPAELRMLANAVQSSSFLTERKAAELIEKLSGLTSSYEAKYLKRILFVTQRIQTMNQSIYETVDILNHALLQRRKISFIAMQWKVNADYQAVKEPQNGGEPIIISPWRLYYEHERYYLAAYDEKQEQTRQYALEDMREIKILQEERMGEHTFQKTIFADAQSQQMLTVRCTEASIGAICERFGEQVKFCRQQDNAYIATFSTVINAELFGYLCAKTPNIRILQPTEAAQKYRAHLSKVLQNQT